MKIVINRCFGGFGMSESGYRRYAELKGLTLYPEVNPSYPSLGVQTYYTVPPEARGPFLEGEAWHHATLEERQASNERWKAQTLYCGHLERTDPLLVRVVEELGAAANGRYAELKVVEIPDGVEWELDEYDGVESIHEKHRSWG